MTQHLLEGGFEKLTLLDQKDNLLILKLVHPWCELLCIQHVMWTIIFQMVPSVAYHDHLILYAEWFLFMDGIPINSYISVGLSRLITRISKAFSGHTIRGLCRGWLMVAGGGSGLSNL